MKKLQALSAVCITAMGMLTTGCSLLGGSEGEIEYIAVQEEDGGAWSFMDREGKIVLSEEFTGTAYGVMNGMFVVQNDDKYTLYKFDEKKPMPVKDCEDLKGAGLYNEGLVPVVKEKERITLINEDGETVFALEPYKGKEITMCSPVYTEGLLYVYTEDLKAGYVDTKGKMVIEPKFDFGNPFSEGLAVVFVQDKDKETLTYKVIDKKGEVVFSMKKGWNAGAVYENGRLAASDTDGRMYIFDKKGEMEKCPTKVTTIGSFGKKAYTFSNSDGEWGVMSYDGEMIVRAKYKYTAIMEDGKYLGTKDDAFEILNADGEVEKTVSDYEYAQVIEDFGIVARDNKSFQFFNSNGEELRNANFADYNHPIMQPLESDFFNTEAFASAIANLFTDNGVGKFTFDSAPRSMVSGNPNEYAYTSNVELTDLNIEGYRYEVYPSVRFTEYISKYDVDRNTYVGTYVWNPDCKVGFFSVNARCRIEITRDVIDAILSALEKKGYTQFAASDKDKEDVFIALKKGKVLLGISTKLDSYSMTIEQIKDEDGTIAENVKNWVNSK